MKTIAGGVPAIKHLAFQKGITGRTISKTCGVSEPTAQNWLSGITRPRSQVIIEQLEALFGCPAEGLFKRITITIEPDARRQPVRRQ